MKTITNKQVLKLHIYLMALFLLFIGNLQAQAQALQTQLNNAPNSKGLFQRLIEIKYTSELYLSIGLKNEKQKDTALATYNTLRWMVDGFVYQLSSEMISNNSPRAFRKLNDWCLDGKSETSQRENIEAIEQFFETNIQSSIRPVSKNINLSTNVFYLIKDSYSVIKGLSDIKTQKTMALIELLDHTRFLSPGEVVKLGVK
jgi:hypothetical protein